jgi:hypothetical protein
MGVNTYGWIEVKESFASYEGPWLGVIKVQPLLFGSVSAQVFRTDLHEFTAEGMPADVSNEVKADWDPTYNMSPRVLNWEDAWKVDTEIVYGDWWALVQMVETLSKMSAVTVKLSIRFVYWV